LVKSIECHWLICHCLYILRIYRMTSIDISFIRAFILFFQAYWQATGNRNVVIERAIHPRNMFDKIRTAIAFLLSSISFSLFYRYRLSLLSLSLCRCPRIAISAIQRTMAITSVRSIVQQIKIRQRN